MTTFSESLDLAIDKILGYACQCIHRRSDHPKIAPNWVEVNPMRLQLPHLDREFHGYRLVQISDTHIDSSLTGEHLRQVVTLINRQKPDLIALTGDYFSYRARPFTKDLAAAFSKLAPKDALVAVLGNHDHWTDPEAIREALRASGAIPLDNAVHTLRRGASALHIAGVDNHSVQRACIKTVLKQLPQDGAAILLAHEPDYAEISSKTKRFDLQLSGHTHGGQIRIPLLGSPLLPKHGRKYPLGLYNVRGMYQYTNRGLGTGILKLRLNCPAEITVFTLESPNGKSSNER